METVRRMRMRAWAARLGRRRVVPIGAAVLGAALTVIVVVTAGGQAATGQGDRAGELRTERLTVVGPDGAPRMVLGELTVGDLQGTGLVVYDRDGRTPRLAQGVTSGGQSGVVVFDSRGNARLELGTGWAGRDDGSVNLTGRAADGTPRFELAFDPNAPGEGLALVRLRDANGQARAVIVALPDGGVAINLGDREQRLRAQLSLDAGGAPELRLLDEHDAVIWRAP